MGIILSSAVQGYVTVFAGKSAFPSSRMEDAGRPSAFHPEMAGLIGRAFMQREKKKPPIGERTLKEQFIQLRTSEHPTIMPDAHLLMQPNKRNAPEWCVSLRPSQIAGG